MHPGSSSSFQTTHHSVRLKALGTVKATLYCVSCPIHYASNTGIILSRNRNKKKNKKILRVKNERKISHN